MNFNRNSQFMRWTYPDGSDSWADGEFYYNEQLQRYEHDVEYKGVNYLIIF